jgi:hypothetical protein
VLIVKEFVNNARVTEDDGKTAAVLQMLVPALLAPIKRERAFGLNGIALA